jgi:hypothetical protein
LLVLASDSSNFSRTRLSVVPELSPKAGSQVAPQWRIIAGYDLLYWTNVQRAGGGTGIREKNRVATGPDFDPCQEARWRACKKIFGWKLMEIVRWLRKAISTSM